MKRAASSKGFSSTTRYMGQRASSQRCLKATSLPQLNDKQAEKPAVDYDDVSPTFPGPYTSTEAMTENDNDNRNVDTVSADANTDNNDSISNSNGVKRECRIHKRRIKRSTTDPSDQRSITSTSRDSQRSGRSFRIIRYNSTSSDDDAAGPSASNASHGVSRRTRGNINEDQSDQPANTKKRISNTRVRRIQEKSTTSSGIAVAQRRQRRPLTRAASLSRLANQRDHNNTEDDVAIQLVNEKAVGSNSGEGCTRTKRRIPSHRHLARALSTSTGLGLLCSDYGSNGDEAKNDINAD